VASNKLHELGLRSSPLSLHLGFCSSDYDFALFLNITPHGCIMLSLYVDNIIITGDDVDGIAKLKMQLRRKLEMNDLGSLHYFLGIEVAYSPRGYLLSQSKYIVNVLEHACLSDTRTIDTPLKLNEKCLL